MLRKINFDLYRSSRALAASGLVAITLAPAAMAAPPGDIVLGDITVMRLTTPVGNVTAEQRASMVQDRINQAIAIPNLADKDVRLVVEQSGPTIYVRKIKIVTIDPGTAAAEGVTPIVLAKTWAHRLMGVIAQVCIRVPVAPPAGGGPEIAATPGQPAPATSAAATGAPAVATTTPAAAPSTAPAASPNTPATPTTPASAPAPTAPVVPASAPATPSTPAQPAAPVTPAAPAPVTPAAIPSAPTTPPAPTVPATPPTTPPATPTATPPATPPVAPPATPPAAPPASAIA